MDAIELLQHDHRMVEQLFRDYQAAASSKQRSAVAQVVVRELSKHAAVEELMFYPLTKRVLPDGEGEVSEQLSQHMKVKQLLVDLDRMPEEGRMGELMGELDKSVAEHIREEEGDLMPKVRQHVDQQALDELGEALDKAKATAPTRPHPGAPDQPPALVLAAPVAAIYDRLRDRFQGRPRT